MAKRPAPSIDWRDGVAESLPYEDDFFDAVISQFGLMFFRDRPVALGDGADAGVTRPDCSRRLDCLGTFRGLSEECAQCLEQGDLHQEAADALRAPFVLGDHGKLSTLFGDAGCTSVEITTHHGKARFPSIRAMVEADLRGWLPVMGVILTENQIESILREAEQVLSPYLTAKGTVGFDAPAHLVTAAKS